MGDKAVRMVDRKIEKRTILKNPDAKTECYNLIYVVGKDHNKVGYNSVMQKIFGIYSGDKSH